MMNFEERRAEIFRRSDERIKIKKQNRKRILLSTMSLIIFVSVISAVAASPLTKGSMPDGTWGMDSLNEEYFFVEITNTETGYSKKIDDTERAYAAAEILTQYTPDGIPDDNLQVSPTEDLRTELKNTDFYEITFGNESESKTLFTLSGNILTEVDTQHEYQLSKAELEEILNALGIDD